MTESTGLEPALVATPVVAEITSTAESTPAVIDANVKTPEPEAISENAQRRIDRLTREKRELEWELDRRGRNTQQTTAQPAAEPDKPKALPTLAEHNYDEAAYQAALTAHVTAEAARQVRDEFRKEQEQLTQKQRTESWRKRESDFAAKTPDYQDKAYYAPIPDKAAEIIKDCENGPAIAYYFGSNPAEAEALHGLSEAAMARAIGRIEAKLDAPPAPTPVPVAKPASKAPPPPPKIEATEPAVSKPWNDPTLSQEEFNTRRRQQIARRR